MTERTNLETHVDLCELRYKQLDDRMTRIEHKVEEITVDMHAFKEEMRKNFSEIKNMLQVAKDEKCKAIIASGGSVVVGLLALLGYIVVHLK